METKTMFKGALAGLLSMSCMLTGCSAAPTNTIAEEDASISINGKAVDGAKVIETENGVYLPLDALNDMLYTSWDAEGKNVQVSEKPINTGEKNTVTFYITRHGETLFNTKHLAQGWCDSPLTEKGIAVAKKLGESLKDIPFVAAYSSISERAMDTAEYALGGRGLEVQASEGLKEMNYGTMEGGTNEDLEVIAKDMNLEISYFFDTNGFDVLGGETLAEFEERLLNELNTIGETYAPVGGNILIASHGDAIKKIVKALTKEGDPAYEAVADGVKNCSITIIEWNDGEFNVKVADDISYIE